MDDDALDTALSADLNEAASYVDTELGPIRAAAIHFYNARGFGDEEEGRSSVVVPVVRDTIRATLPSLMKKFFASRNVVTFSSGSKTGGNFAADATAAVQYVFTVQNDGYMILWGAFKDALRTKSGWIKWWWDETVEVTSKCYTGVTEEQVQAMQAVLKPTEELRIDSKEHVSNQQVPGQLPPQVMAQYQMVAHAAQAQGQQPPPPPQAPPQTVPVFEYKIHIVTKTKKKQVRVANVPSDEIIFNRDNFDLDTGRLVCHRSRKTRGELFAMGISRDLIDEAASDDLDTRSNPEFLARQTIPSGNFPTDSMNATWDQELVPYYEAYYRVDKDGDGISELRKICKLGINGPVVSDDLFNEVPLAQLCPDPEPHVLIGNSQADFLMDLQSINSHVFRDILDSLKQSIFPRMAYVEGQANMDDVLSTEIGAPIRQRQPGMVAPFVIPFTGAQAFPVLEELDKQRESRTGVGNAAMALDSSALQSTTPVAAAASVSASQQQVDLTARMFANGVCRMFRGILRLLVQYQDNEMQFELNGRTFNVNPTKWNPDLHAVPDTGLGVGGNTDIKLGVLGKTADAMKEMIQVLGAQNPLCSLENYYNVLCDLLETAGIRDSTRYWTSPAESAQKGIKLQPPKPSPEEILAQAQVQIEGAKLDKDRLKIILDDERERDQMQITAMLTLTEINAKYGAHFDGKQIEAIMARERNATQLAVTHMTNQNNLDQAAQEPAGE
jgi:hypothetical protein